MPAGPGVQLHDELFDLDRPELITVTEAGMVPAAVAAPFDRMGWRYVRFHVAGHVAGSFSAHQPTVSGMALHEDAPLDQPFGFKVKSTSTEPVGAGEHRGRRVGRRRASRSGQALADAAPGSIRTRLT